MSLARALAATPYAGYLYAYPHKTAYRRLEPRVPLEKLWAGEDRERLFLYFHVPFCEMRCGFCNLFTTTSAKDDLVAGYLDALERQARAVKGSLGRASFARFAIGGGTPTFLDTRELERVLDLAEGIFGADLPRIPVSVETSPETVTKEKLALLRSRGVDRISIGVQSFDRRETDSVLRPQDPARVDAALGLLKEFAFRTLNVDLIYGLPEQTPKSWIASLDRALAFEPEELYLYPLYVRPLTGLGKTGRAWDDQRIALYRAGRERLLARGWTQVSMRMFRAPDAATQDGPVYCCQEDGMVGVGSGARSYTDRVHWSTEYAVAQSGVRQILREYVSRTEFGFADWGIRLDEDDRRRRFVILSVLLDGVDLDTYRHRFGGEALDDLPMLGELVERGMAAIHGNVLALTEAGRERSDAIGPALVSAQVKERMEAWQAR